MVYGGCDDGNCHSEFEQWEHELFLNHDLEVGEHEIKIIILYLPFAKEPKKAYHRPLKKNWDYVDHGISTVANSKWLNWELE